MAQPQDSSQPTTDLSDNSLQSSVTPAVAPSVATIEALYQQGVNALKNRDFTQAIAQFQQLHRVDTVPPAYRLKARMGLIRAYQQLGQMEQARTLCQPLLTSPTAQVRQWASQTLQALAGPSHDPESSPEPDPAAANLPTPTGPTTQVLAGEPPLALTDRSGFIPLADPAAPPVSTSAATPQAADRQSVPPSQSTPARPRSASTPVTNPAIAQPQLASSLFHYQQLNAQARLKEQSVAAGQNTVPTAPPEPTAAETRPSADVPHPQQAAPPGRAAAVQPLPKIIGQLWGVQLVTALIAVWGINAAFHLSLRSLNGLVQGLPWPLRLGGIPGFGQDYSVWVISGLIGLALVNPWLMDWLLAWGYGQRSLPTRHLQTHHPDVLRLLRQVCRQQGWQLPELRLIPDPAPLCFSYGWLARNTRIVVSQGLLDTCSQEDLTTLYSYELAHLANGDLPVMSAVGGLLLLLYTGYWRLALWGNALAAKPARLAVGLLANGLYGLFWLLRKLALWLSRLRCFWCDWRAITFTQNPGQLQQSLLALTANLANHFRHQPPCHPLLVSLDVLMPLSPQAAISPGSFFPSVDYLTVIAEDSLNPYRRWLRANSSHPALAERLHHLDRQALRLAQPPLLPDLGADRPVARVELSLLLLQKAPVVGLLAGGGVALGLWFVGGIVQRFGWQRLSWFYQDPSLLQGGLLLGLGLGLLVRINSLYPDINPRLLPTDEPGADLVTGTKTLPVQGQPIRLEGKLIGAPGLANWFGQDLHVETSEGLLRLRAASPLLGWRGLTQSPRHVTPWLGRQVQVSGWCRQAGGLLWLDLADVGAAAQRHASQRNYFVDQAPLWATLLSLGLCLGGIWVILTGG